jgi:hypothetical protein
MTDEEPPTNITPITKALIIREKRSQRPPADLTKLSHAVYHDAHTVHVRMKGMLVGSMSPKVAREWARILVENADAVEDKGMGWICDCDGCRKRRGPK